VTNDFGTPGAAEHAIPLDTPDQASRFNRRLVNACIRADSQAGPVRPGQLHFAIIGAGATGTELAAGLHETTRQVVATGLTKIDPERDIRIILIEAAPRILPALSQRIATATHALLLRMGIVVRDNARVSAVSAEGVTLASGEFIPAALTVWAAGVKGQPILGQLGLEATRGNQLVVRPTLQTSQDPAIFAIGDCAYCVLEGKTQPLPPRAQTAHQQASFVAAQIGRILRGAPLTAFSYRDFGSLVTLGRSGTVGHLMGLVGRNFFIEGMIARLTYRSLYKMHQNAVQGPARVVADTIARALTRRADRVVKLH
jgi:NADH dehydrogenase